MKTLKAIIGGAVWVKASLWSCWGCEFFLPEANWDRPDCLPVNIKMDETGDRLIEGGRCQFCKKIEVSIPGVISEVHHTETPCGIKYAELLAISLDL